VTPVISALFVNALSPLVIANLNWVNNGIVLYLTGLQSYTIATVLKKVKKNILFLGSFAGNYRVCLPVFRLFRSRFPDMAAASTDICIDGYPRSGNTYFVSAFLDWNQGLSVSHHTHLAGNVMYALKRDIPTVVLIRGPEDAVTSVLVWDGLLNTTVALASYIHFYHRLWKHRENFLGLSFDEVTKQPDICVQKINRRFNRQFFSKALSAKEDEKIRARLTRVDLRCARGTFNSSLPNPQKSQLKKELSERVLNSWLYPYAQRLFLKYSEL